MKKFFYAILLLQFVAETFAGLMLIFFHKAAAPQAASSEWFLMISMGFVALTVSVATVMLWLQRHSLSVVSFATALFAVFHTFIAIAALIAATMGADFTPYLSHVFFGICFWLLWFRRSRLVF